MSILPIFIPHAGCPHQCVFCNQKTISGQKLAAVAGAKEQLMRWRSWLRPSAANEAAFYGGSFTGLPLELQEELLALTDALLAEGFIGTDDSSLVERMGGRVRCVQSPRDNLKVTVPETCVP